MNESALRILIANLEGSQSSFHWWLQFFTALVVIGVVLEVVFVIWEFRESLHDFRQGIVGPPDKPSVLLLIFGLVGASLVAVGVAGEFREEAKIERVETQIRKADDDLYLLLSREAGDAKASASEAANAASRAKAEADQVTGIAAAARSIADDAKGGATDARRQVTGLQGQADLLKSDIAAEEEELTRLNAPRRLTNSEDMVKRLANFRGTEYTFSGVFDDQESIQFLLAIDGVLQEAGWNRLPPPRIGTLPLFGLPVFGSNGPLLAETSGAGVRISVEVPTKTIRTIDEVPQHARAALELNDLLFSDMYPPEPDAKTKKPFANQGASRTVDIMVGSKLIQNVSIATHPR